MYDLYPYVCFKSCLEILKNLKNLINLEKDDDLKNNAVLITSIWTNRLVAVFEILYLMMCNNHQLIITVNRLVGHGLHHLRSKCCSLLVTVVLLFVNSR